MQIQISSLPCLPHHLSHVQCHKYGNAHQSPHCQSPTPSISAYSKREVSKYVETAAVEQPLTPSPAVRRNVEQVGAQWFTLIYHSCNTFGACDLCTVHYNILNNTAVCRIEHGLSKICCFPRVTQMKLSYLCTLHTKWA